jgi:hypothetical protein
LFVLSICFSNEVLIFLIAISVPFKKNLFHHSTFYLLGFGLLGFSHYL